MKGIRRWTGLLLGAVLACTPRAEDVDLLPSREPEPEPEPDYVGLVYDYAVDLDTRDARSTLTLQVLQAGNCVELPFRANRLAEVAIDGVPLERDVFGETATFCAPTAWEAGDEIVIETSQRVPNNTLGTTQVGYTQTSNGAGDTFHYLLSWVEGCDQFGPCDVRPDRFAEVHFEVTHPPGTQVLCPGTITKLEPTLTRCDFDFEGGPTYSTFGFIASPDWTEVDLGDWDGISVTGYSLAATELPERLDVARHQGFMAFMQSRFGPFPYGDELRIVSATTFWNGFEHPGNIVLAERLGLDDSAFPDPLGHTTDHEIAHMWAGDQTTLADRYDFVWKEAMAEYLVYVYEDEVLGDASAPSVWKLFSQGARYHPVPLEQPALVTYYGDVYGLGPMVLFRQLEVLTSREQVLTALQSLLGQPRSLSVDDVQAALEASTGEDLDAYFDAWVRGTGALPQPSLSVELSGGDETVSVTVTQTAPAEAMGCGFTVQLTGDGGETFDVPFDLGVNGTLDPVTVDVEPGFPATGHILDPYDESLVRVPVTRAAPTALPENPWVPGWRSAAR